MKKTFTVSTGKQDSNGDIIKSTSDTFPKTVPVTRDFRHDQDPLGYCEVFQEGELLKATAEIDEKHLDYYPAIGLIAKESHINEQGIRVITKMKLLEVSLCGNPNSDPHIGSIRKQTEK